MPEISKTADQALAILEHVAEHGPVAVADVARALRMHRTVVHRSLATLQQRGFVRRVEGGFTAGITLLRLAQAVEPELLAAARPVLEKLARAHGETFILTVRDGDEAVQVEQAVGSRHFVRVQLARGFRHPLPSGASGRAILAFLDGETVARLVNATPAPRKLAALVAQARADGYAASHDELSAGVHGLSCPILAGGTVVGSIGVVTPAIRAGSIGRYARVLGAAAKTIAASLAR
ncbi:MAG: IclR family transcriptional regulator [Burkholderiales bacterium]|nr:IclR family transcriptional regulator [Burkholderiales bacterium]